MRGNPAAAHRAAGPPAPPRHRDRRGQGLLRGRLRGVPRQSGPGPDPPGPERRQEAAALPELAAPARRGDHRDAAEPARPGTPRRPGAGGPAGPRRAAPAGAERGDLAQLDDRRAGQAVPDRLRPQDLVTSADSPVTDPGRLRLIPPRLPLTWSFP